MRWRTVLGKGGSAEHCRSDVLQFRLGKSNRHLLRLQHVWVHSLVPAQALSAIQLADASDCVRRPLSGKYVECTETLNEDVKEMHEVRLQPSREVLRLEGRFRRWKLPPCRSSHLGTSGQDRLHEMRTLRGMGVPQRPYDPQEEARLSDRLISRCYGLAAGWQRRWKDTIDQ